MRIFHLADLHIGKNVNGFSMLPDQIYILEQILGLVIANKPDVVIIAGDVYDKTVPPADAVCAFDKFLTGLVREAVKVMVIGGNHDSPERIEFAGRIISDNGVYLCGVYDGTVHNVTVTDEFGDVVFYLLPFVKPSVVRRFFEEASVESYHDAVKTAIGATDIDASKRNVLITHQFFINPGNEPERSESEISPVGGIDSVDIHTVSGFDYAALGHLHGPQKVKHDVFRYAGSPLKYSASECNHKKSVTMVELKAKGDITVTQLPLEPIRDMRKIKGPLSLLTSEEILTQVNNDDYLHITLTDEDEIIDAIGKIRSVYKNVMSLSFENSRTNALADSAEEIRSDSITPYELFETFFLEQNGLELKPKQAGIARRLLDNAGEIQ